MAEALRVFEDVRVLLREELGTAPGPALVALHERLREEPASAPAPEPTAPPAPAGGGLVERELAALGALLGDALAGEGRTALIERPAGVGKTRLLGEVRRRAETAGARVLSARGSDLEREYPFGVVRQLLEGAMAGTAENEAQRAAIEDQLGRIRAAMAPWAAGTALLNFADGPAGPRDAFCTPTFRRLCAVRKRVDPSAVFAAGHPIPTAA